MKLFTLIGALLLTLTTHAAPTVGGLPVPTFSSADENGVLSSISNTSGRTPTWTSSTTPTISFTNEVSGVTLAGNTTVTLANVPTSTNIDKAITIKVVGNGSYTLAITGIVDFTGASTLTPPSGLSEVMIRWEAGGTNAYPSWKQISLETLIFTSPYGSEGTNCVMNTNNVNSGTFGQVLFSATAATNENFCWYQLTWPSDFVTNDTVTLEVFMDSLNASDITNRIYYLGVYQPAFSGQSTNPISNFTSATNWIEVNIPLDASGAGGDSEGITNRIILTNWNTYLTAGRKTWIYQSRYGPDGSVAASWSSGMQIQYSAVKRSKR